MMERKRGRLGQGGAVTIVIYLNKRLIIQTNSTFPGRERERGAEQGLTRKETALIYKFDSTIVTISVTGHS